MRYRWLPRTAANIAVARVRVPRGFDRQVSTHVESGGFATVTVKRTKALGCGQS
jgi:hypothetical protein